MDHAGDIARRIKQETLHAHGDRAAIVPGGNRKQQTLIVWSHEGYPFRVTIREIEQGNLTDEELNA